MLGISPKSLAIVLLLSYALTSLKTMRILEVYKGGFQCKKN